MKKIKVTDEITSYKECLTTSWSGLSSEARHEYEKVCRLMIQRGNLRADALPIIATYAQAQIDVRIANKCIEEHGPIILENDRNGHPKYNPNPAVKMKRDAEKIVTNVALMLGFTPLGRKRLKGEEKAPKSALEKLREKYDTL